ncbi:hypothetical protein [Streptomyces sp. NPDC004435]|uniref:hypothetical protein n=1 Tax=Streptomyces sp. NPDC004435 TaxID=3364701 RepID=UPI0036C66ABF
MRSIVDLWESGEVPDRDALYRADGVVREVHVDSAALSGFGLGAPLDLDELLRDDPDGLAAYDIHRGCWAELPDGSGFVCGGGGAHGSEGFVARLDADRRLVWVVRMGDSNPFERVELDGMTARFLNNLGNAIEIDLTAPDFRP